MILDSNEPDKTYSKDWIALSMFSIFSYKKVSRKKEQISNIM